METAEYRYTYPNWPLHYIVPFLLWWAMFIPLIWPIAYYMKKMGISRTSFAFQVGLPIFFFVLILIYMGITKLVTEYLFDKKGRITFYKNKVIIQQNKTYEIFYNEIENIAKEILGGIPYPPRSPKMFGALYVKYTITIGDGKKLKFFCSKREGRQLVGMDFLTRKPFKPNYSIEKPFDKLYRRWVEKNNTKSKG